MNNDTEASDWWECRQAWGAAIRERGSSEADEARLVFAAADVARLCAR